MTEQSKAQNDLEVYLTGEVVERVAFQPITLIHRHEDGFIHFEKEIDGKWKQVVSLRPPDLRGMFPQFRHWLAKDCYFTPNATGSKGNQPHYISKTTGQPIALRRTALLRYLTCFYADIDCGRPDDPDPFKRLSWEVAAGILLKRMNDGKIPVASMFARSGRGLYAFWLIRREGTQADAERASVQLVALWQDIQRELGRRMLDLGWDKTSVDAVKVLRVPGTIHSKASESTGEIETAVYFANSSNPETSLVDEAQALIPITARGIPFYTMREMAHRLDVPILGSDTKRRSVEYKAPKRRNPNCRNGFRLIGARVAHDMTLIQSSIGGWKRGTRRRRLQTYAYALRRSGLPQETTLRRCRQMASLCKPPFPSDTNDTPVSQIVDGVYREKYMRFNRAKLIEVFRVTPEMARKLDLQFCIPPIVQLERKQAHKTRDQKALDRRNFIRGWLERHQRRGTPPSLEQMRAIVLKEHKARVSRMTISNDYAAIGTKRAPGSPGRPKKLPRD